MTISWHLGPVHMSPVCLEAYNYPNGMLYKKEEPGNEVDALFRLQSSTKYLRTPPPSPHLMLLHCLIIIQILINYALDFESANGQLRF
jgi:hypothetical protein